MSLKDKEKWNAKYGASECLAGRDPCDWLTSNREYLTGRGRALDLAMGEGRNAVFAAGLGYQVLGVDISDVGVKRARALAEEQGLSLQTLVVDLEDWPLPESAFDLVMCFYYLERKLFPALRRALRPGGILVFETFTVDYLKYSSFKREWVLEPNELLHAFSALRVLHYRETDDAGAEKAVASLVARKETHAPLD